MGERVTANDRSTSFVSTLSKSGLIEQTIETNVIFSPALRPNAEAGRAAPIKACVIGDATIQLIN